MDKNNSNNNYNLSIKTIILTFLILFLSIISYFIFNYYKKNVGGAYTGYSYYNKNILEHKPVFTLNTLSFEDCKNHCNFVPSCRGFTLSPQEEKCFGSGVNSILRKEENNEIKSWIKPEDSVFTADTNLLLTYTDKAYTIKNNNIVKSYTDNNYNYNFYMYINNFETGVWKHVFHKGTEFDNINTNDWNEISNNIKEQYIGVWLAPYNTTIRIAITNDVGNIEYIDIPNNPIREKIFFSINILGKNIEIYRNSLLIKVVNMKENPFFNNGNLYCKNNKSFNGHLLYLTFTPDYLNYKKIKTIYEQSQDEITQFINSSYL